MKKEKKIILSKEVKLIGVGFLACLCCIYTGFAIYATAESYEIMKKDVQPLHQKIKEKKEEEFHNNYEVVYVVVEDGTNAFYYQRNLLDNKTNANDFLLKAEKIPFNFNKKEKVENWGEIKAGEKIALYKDRKVEPPFHYEKEEKK